MSDGGEARRKIDGMMLRNVRGKVRRGCRANRSHGEVKITDAGRQERGTRGRDVMDVRDSSAHLRMNTR